MAICKSLPSGIGIEDTKKSWRTAEAWRLKRSGEAIGEGPALVLVKALGVI